MTKKFRFSYTVDPVFDGVTESGWAKWKPGRRRCYYRGVRIPLFLARLIVRSYTRR